PFNPTTEIRFSVPEASSVRLTVYNILGQKIKVLVNDVIGQGNHTVVWDGSDNDGKQVSSGIYFYRMQGENFAAVKKMIFAK
ncbi:T9SS type A sorting domain-containing protein, partial [Sphingobacteriales bacterium CHB3]|nr:T9SS type A sorting domain-containing protein [Sphingobacteriales bacterium CHB3]